MIQSRPGVGIVQWGLRRCARRSSRMRRGRRTCRAGRGPATSARSRGRCRDTPAGRRASVTSGSSTKPSTFRIRSASPAMLRQALRGSMPSERASSSIGTDQRWPSPKGGITSARYCDVLRVPGSPARPSGRGTCRGRAGRPARRRGRGAESRAGTAGRPRCARRCPGVARPSRRPGCAPPWWLPRRDRLGVSEVAQDVRPNTSLQSCAEALVWPSRRRRASDRWTLPPVPTCGGRAASLESPSRQGDEE